jgi:hypothetical protein
VAKKAKGSAIDKRTTRHPGYRVSLKIRKRIEEGFGWLRTTAGMRKTRLVGREKMSAQVAAELCCVPPDPHRQPVWLVARRACIGPIAPPARPKAVVKRHKPRQCPKSKPLEPQTQPRRSKNGQQKWVMEGIAEFFKGLIRRDLPR